MRDHWKQAPKALRQRVEAHLAVSDPYNGALVAFNNGYDFRPAEVPTTFRDRLAALRKTDPAEAGTYSATHSDKLRLEKLATELSEARRTWAEGPSKAEQADAERKERAAQAKLHEKLVQERMKALETQQKAAAAAALRAQAEQAVGQ